MKTTGRRIVMLAAATAFAGAFTYACQSGAGPAAGTGDAASQVYVAARRVRRVLRLHVGRLQRQRDRPRPAVGPPDQDGARVLAVPRERLGLLGRDEGHAEDVLRLRAVGRRPPPGALADRRRAGRPLDLHQRQQHAAGGAHRPDDVRDRRDPRDPELGREPRLAVHHARLEVPGGVDALQRADPQATCRSTLQGELQRHDLVHPRRPAGRTWTSRSRSWCRATTTTWRTPGRVRPTAGRSSPPTTPSRRTRCSRSTRRRTTRTSWPP